MAIDANYLAQIQQAKLDLISGKRVGQVNFQGRLVKYTEVTLSQLQTEEDRVARILNAPKKKRFSVLSTSKGL